MFIFLATCLIELAMATNARHTHTHSVTLVKSQPLNRHVAIAVSRPLLVVASAFHSFRCRNSACTRAIFCQIFLFRWKKKLLPVDAKSVCKMRKIDKALDEMLSTFAHIREHDTDATCGSAIDGRTTKAAELEWPKISRAKCALVLFAQCGKRPTYGAKNTRSDRSKSYRRHTWQFNWAEERKTNNVHMLKWPKASKIWANDRFEARSLWSTHKKSTNREKCERSQAVSIVLSIWLIGSSEYGYNVHIIENWSPAYLLATSNESDKRRKNVRWKSMREMQNRWITNEILAECRALERFMYTICIVIIIALRSSEKSGEEKLSEMISHKTYKLVCSAQYTQTAGKQMLALHIRGTEWESSAHGKWTKMIEKWIEKLCTR